jgi:hypothetical protein
VVGRRLTTAAKVASWLKHRAILQGRTAALPGRFSQRTMADRNESVPVHVRYQERSLTSRLSPFTSTMRPLRRKREESPTFMSLKQRSPAKTGDRTSINSTTNELVNCLESNERRLLAHAWWTWQGVYSDISLRLTNSCNATRLLKFDPHFACSKLTIATLLKCGPKFSTRTLRVGAIPRSG